MLKLEVFILIFLGTQNPYWHTFVGETYIGASLTLPLLMHSNASADCRTLHNIDAL